MLPGVKAEDFPDGEAAAAEWVRLTTHNGTHLDAPWHYHSTMNKGERAMTIDEVPLEWCFGNGVLLDFRDHDRIRGITCEDVQRELDRIGHELKPLDIVLVMTGTDLRSPGYELRHPGLRVDATEFLVDHGVRLIGIDAWGLDRPFDVMVEDARAGRAQFWESHLLGRRKEYCQIERLANLDALPRPTGFLVAAFPVKIERASAGWARVVAIVDE
jgi:kynurenine formamidase